MGETGRPCSWRSFCTFTRLMRLLTSFFTRSRPHSVQLGQHLVQVRGRERIVLRRGGLLFRWSAGPGPGDKLVRFQGGPVPLQASAQGQQEVGAGIDKAGLRLADHVIHRSKEQQEQCQLVNEGAGQTAVGEAVILPETVKKGGGLKLVKAGHPGGHLPSTGGGAEEPLV